MKFPRHYEQNGWLVTLEPDFLRRIATLRIARQVNGNSYQLMNHARNGSIEWITLNPDDVTADDELSELGGINLPIDSLDVLGQLLLGEAPLTQQSFDQLRAAHVKAEERIDTLLDAIVRRHLL